MWTRENDYDAVIVAAAARYGVPVSVLKGIIGLESGFDPVASRAEPQLPPVNVPGLEHGGDSSYGLMQLLYRTAWALGYRGAAQALYNPAVNVPLGARFFGDLYEQARANGWGLDSALSAYNAGGSGDRPGDGKRKTSRKDGRVSAGGPLAPFVNQAYVDRVLGYVRYFAGKGADVSVGSPSLESRGGSSSVAVLGVLAGLGVLWYFFQALDAGSAGELRALGVPAGQVVAIGLVVRFQLRALSRRLAWCEAVLRQLAAHGGVTILEPGGPRLVWEGTERRGNK